MRRQPLKVIDQSDDKWHWDRKVPIALIVTFIFLIGGQSATALWWASKMDSRVDNLEKASLVSAPNGDRLTRVEVKLEAVQAGITEIKSILREPVVPAKAR